MRISKALPFLVLIFLFACKKDETDNTPAGPGRFSALKFDLGARQYTINLFDYDAQGRVTRIREYDVDSSLTPAAVDSLQTLVYFYGTGNLPTGYQYREPGFSYTGSYRYDAQGRPVVDSPHTVGSGYITRISYPAGQVVKFTQVTPVGGPPFTQRDTAFFNGQNMSAYSTSQGVPGSYQMTTYSPSGVSSPLWDLNVAPLLKREWMGLISRQLPSSETLRNETSIIGTATYSHSLNPAGKVGLTRIEFSGISFRAIWEYQ